MSLYNDRGLFETDKEMSLNAVSHKKHRSACRQINQRFHKGFMTVIFPAGVNIGRPVLYII